MREQVKLTAFASASMLVLSGVMTGLSASLSEIAETFSIAQTRAGVLYTIHFAGFLSFVFFSLVVRGLRRRLWLVLITAAVYVMALLGAGFSASLLLLGVALFLAGGSGGILESHTATLQVMTAGSEAEASRAVSITQVFFAVGALGAPLYLSITADTAGSWRPLLLGLSAVAAVAVVVGLFMRAGRFDTVRGEGGSLHIKSLLGACAALTLYVGAEVTLFGWAPTVMETYRGIPEARARLAPTVFWIGILVGRVLVARISGRLSPRTLLAVSSWLGAVGALMLSLVGSEALLWTAVLLAALGSAGIWPLVVATTGSAGGELATPITIGAGAMGAAIFPYLAGLTAELMPGQFIPIVAAPLLVGVFFLTRATQSTARTASAAES
jgi:fucose permease